MEFLDEKSDNNMGGIVMYPYDSHNAYYSQTINIDSGETGLISSQKEEYSRDYGQGNQDYDEKCYFDNFLMKTENTGSNDIFSFPQGAYEEQYLQTDPYTNQNIGQTYDPLQHYNQQSPKDLLQVTIKKEFIENEYGLVHSSNGDESTSYVKSDEDVPSQKPPMKVKQAQKVGNRRSMGCKKERKKHGKYTILSEKEKRKAVQLAKIIGAKEVSKLNGLPVKNLKRWIQFGCERKKGGGRKRKDPEMEKKLYVWYLDLKSKSEPVTARMIKETALAYSTKTDFNASKGWLDKLKMRYNLQIDREKSLRNREIKKEE